jgi:hypothetical protein
MVVENIGNQQHDFFTKDSEKHKLGLEQLLDEYSKPSDLIAISGGPNPQEMYFAHRKGWIFNQSDISDKPFLINLQKNDCKLVVINKHHFDYELDLLNLIYEDDDYLIYNFN